MSIVKSVRGFTPKFGDNCFLATNAVVVGDVVMGNDCSVWFNTTLRGDVNSIRIGNRVNIQDGSVLHTLYQKSVIEIADNVSIGHNVCVHGARIDQNCLIGIGSVILDHVHVGEGSIIGAGSVVLQGTKIEPGSLYAGTPAKRIKDVDPEQAKEMIERIANNYVMYAGWFQEEDSNGDDR
jgi:carbonic anhydrase/acetyltransferase-like protein (isoleucine patch superfamily)